jgi:hypothetical protein
MHGGSPSHQGVQYSSVVIHDWMIWRYPHGLEIAICMWDLRRSMVGAGIRW